jgi:hypothetical protein
LQSGPLFPHADELPREYPGFLSCLLCPRGVLLRAFRGLDDEALGLGLERLQVIDVAVEGADVLADKGIARSFLRDTLSERAVVRVPGCTYLLLGRRAPEEVLDGLHGAPGRSDCDHAAEGR